MCMELSQKQEGIIVGTYETNMLVFCEMWPYVPQNDLIITAEILDKHDIKAVKNIGKDGVDLYVKVQHTIGRKQVEEWKWITFVESIYLAMVWIQGWEHARQSTIFNEQSSL